MTGPWNAGQDGSSEVLAWLVESTEVPGTYYLVLGADGEIRAPEDSSKLFTSFTNCTDIEGLSLLDTSNVTDMSDMFLNCSSLTNLDVTGFDTSNVTSMYRMFLNCSSLTNLDVTGFDTSKVTSTNYFENGMIGMFFGCSSLTSLDLSNFNTEKLLHMQQMFYECSSLTSLDISNFNTSNVLNMSKMFYKCSSLTSIDLSSFDTSNVMDMSEMFADCSGLTDLDVTGFDTSNVTSMYRMFLNCSSLTSLDVRNFNTSSVTNMAGMFCWCSNLRSIDVTHFDTSSVTTMSEMFQNCSGLTALNVTHFDTSSVLSMDYMFGSCSSLTSLDLSNFNTSAVTTMRYMFESCSSLTSLDVTHFDTSSVTNMEYMFYYCSSLTSLNLSSFNTSSVTTMSEMFYYCSSLTNLDVSSFNTSNVTSMYMMFEKCSSLTNLDVSGFNTSNVKSMVSMFAYCGNLRSLDLSNFDTNNVTNMLYMFAGCGVTRIKLGNNFSFKGKNITDTVDQALLPKGNWSNKEKTIGPYRETYLRDNYTSEMSGEWTRPVALLYDNGELVFQAEDTTDDVVARYAGFDADTYSNQSYIPWDSKRDFVTKVIVKDGIKPISTAYWFYEMPNVTEMELNKLDTSNVTTMYEMFYNCSNLTSLNLSSFNTSNVTNKVWMFLGCTNLETLVLGENFDKINGSSMFSNCQNLKTIISLSPTVMATASNGLPNTAKATLYVRNATLEDQYEQDTTYQSQFMTAGEDRIRPILELVGNSTINATVPGNTYTEEGATVAGFSYESGDIYTQYGLSVRKTVTKDNVSTDMYRPAVPGTYKITYTLSYNGLPIDAVTRTINVTHVKATNRLMERESELRIIGLDRFCQSINNSNFLLPSERVKTITIHNSLSIPNDAYLSWDVSANSDGSVMAWLINNSGGYDLHIGANGNILLPENSTSLFADYRDMVSITGIEYLDTCEVTNMKEMFYECEKLGNLDLNSFDTSNVTNMDGMFAVCQNMTSLNVSTFDTSKVTDMNAMFDLCAKLTYLDLTHFDTSKVTNMNGMFYSCGLTSLDVTHFDTSSVTNMGSMFGTCNDLTSLDLSSFDTSNVTNMQYMFSNCSSITNLDLSGFDTRRVTNVNWMFSGCSSLETIALGNNFVQLPDFRGCTSLEAIISQKAISSSEDVIKYNANTPSGATLYVPNEASESAYEENSNYYTNFSNGERIRPILELIGDKVINLGSNDVFTEQGATVAGYPNGQSGKYTQYGYTLLGPSITKNNEVVSEVVNKGIATYRVTYTLLDKNANTVMSAYRTVNVNNAAMLMQETYNNAYRDHLILGNSTIGVTRSKIKKIIIKTNQDTPTGTIYGSPWDVSYNRNGSVTAWLIDNGDDTYNLVIGGDGNIYAPVDSSYLFCYYTNCTEIEGLTNLNTSNTTNMKHMFYSNSKMTTVDVSNFNTGKVTNMSQMFDECKALTTLNVSNFNTENVTTMSSMFSGCKALTTLDVSNFSTGNVTTMFYMFAECESLTTLDVSNFNTGKVTNMSDMFRSCLSLTTLDVSNFNTGNVTTMLNMFSSCKALTILDVSNFNTENVTTMQSMFSSCSALTTLDLSSFNTEKVTSMAYMFSGCSALTTLDVSNFNTENVTTMYNMFHNCSSLTTLDVSNFNTENVGTMSWMFSDCSALTTLDVSNFNTKKVTDMYRMFSNCSALTTLNLRNFNTEKVTTMKDMFYECQSLTTLDVSNFNTENVTTMSSMFYYCKSLTTLDVSNFNTEKVTTMSGMFSYCRALTTLDVSNFNTGKVTNMSGMFRDCKALKSLLFGPAFDKLNGSDMFNNCTSLESIISQRTVATAKKLSVGDYIAYTPDSNSYTTKTENTGYTSTQSYSTANANWRVLWIDEETGKVLITPASAVNTGIYLRGEVGYYKGALELDSIAEALYSNSSLGVTARSMTIEDINKACGYTPEYTTRYAYYPYTAGAQSGTVEYQGETYQKKRHDSTCKIYVGAKGYGTGVEQIYCEEPIQTDESNGLQYYIPTAEHPVYVTSTQYTYSPSTQNSMIGTVLTSTAGWLASPYVAVGATYASLYMRAASATSVYATNYLAYTSGNPQSRSSALRPVVELDLSTIDTYDSTRDGSTNAKAYQIKTNPSDYEIYQEITPPTLITNTAVNAKTKLYVMNEEAESAYEAATNYDTVFGSDRIRPILELSGDSTVNVFIGESYTDAGATVAGFSQNSSGEYIYDYDVTTSYKTNGGAETAGLPTDFTTAGTVYTIIYNLTYKGTPVAGATVERTVNVRDVPTLMQETYANAYINKYILGNTTIGVKREKIAKITIKVDLDTPEGTIYGDPWDVSKDGDGSVMAWLVDNGDGTYNLVIGGDGTINAPVDSSYLFCYYTNCTEIEGLTNLNTSNTTNMKHMFYSNSKMTTADVSKFSTDNVTNMGVMFMDCKALVSLDISSFNTEKVTSMGSMFQGCSELITLDMSGLNAKNVTTVENMFRNCKKLTTLDLTGFEMEKVTNMSSMFYSCYKLNTLDLSGFNTENVTNMKEMFYECKDLTIADVSGFNTEKVTDMGSMFSNCNNLTTIDVSGFDTRNVTNMLYMFNGCNKVTELNVSRFNTEKVSGIAGMFSGCSSITDLDVTNFETSKITRMASVFSYCSKLNSLDVSNFNTSNVTSMYNLFNNCSSLISLDISNFDTSSVTEMSSMFQGCSALTSINLTGINTKKVQSMSSMFYGCKNLKTINLSSFDTSNVTAMQLMFRGCNSLTSLNLSNFDTGKVTNMHEMFAGCSSLTNLDLSNFDTGKTDISSMFVNCSALKSLLLGPAFDKLNGKDMFTDCTSLESIISQRTVATAKKLLVGDYIAYTPDSNSYTTKTENTGYTSTQSYSTANANWRVLWIDEETGKVLITPASAVNTGIYLRGEVGYYKGALELDNIAEALYSNSSLGVTARSMTIEDINKACGYTPEYTTRYAYYPYTAGVQSGTVEYQGETYQKKTHDSTCKIYVGAKGYGTGVEQIYCEEPIQTDESNGLQYYIPTAEHPVYVTSTQYTYSPSTQNSMIGTVLTSTAGWLSSPYVAVGAKYANLYMRTASSSSVYNTNYLAYTSGTPQSRSSALRPVVELNISAIDTYDSTRDGSTNAKAYQIKTNPSDYEIYQEITPPTLATNTAVNAKTKLYVMNEEVEPAFEGATNYATVFGNDRIRPILELSGDSVVNVLAGESYTDAGATVAGFSQNSSGEYIYDYDVTTSYKTNGGAETAGLPTNFTTAGTVYTIIYNLTYKGTPVAGATVERMVNVRDVPTLMQETVANALLNKYILGNTTIGVKREKIAKITIKVDLDTPEGTIYGDPWDVSKDGDGSVMAWLVDNGDETYNLVIGGDGSINAPVDSSYLFCYYTNCTEIEGLTNLNTSNTTNMSYMFYSNIKMTTADVSNFNTGKVTSMALMFSYCSAVTTLDVSNFNTGNVTSMGSMFTSCSALITLDVSNFNTEKVTNMSYMFSNCKTLTTLDVSNFNTEKVTTMHSMFSYCSAVTTLDVSNFNTGNVTNMYSMFEKCSALTTLDVSNFNTEKVTTMYSMFSYCSAVTTLDVSNFNTENVTNMADMFEKCRALTALDVSNFNTGNVTNMSYMFSSCNALTTLDVSNFNTRNVTYMSCMFSSCNALTTLDVSNFNTENVTNMADMFEKCSALKSILLGPAFDKLNGTNMFSYDSALKAIITQKAITDSANAMTLSTDTGLSTLTNAVLYVPNTTSETAYEAATNYATVFGNDRIRPILELSGDSTVNVFVGGSYTDAGATVAGFSQNSSGEYIYDYDVTTSYKTNGGAETAGLPTDFTTAGTVYTIIYNLTYKGIPVAGATVERTVNVVNLPTLKADNISTNVTTNKYIFGETGTSIRRTDIDKIKIQTNQTAPTGTIAYGPWNVAEDGSSSVIAWLVESIENSGMYNLVIAGNGSIYAPVDCTYLFKDYTNCTAIEGLNLLNTSKTKNMQNMFAGDSKLTSLDVTNFDTSKVTNMMSMFSSCSNLSSLDVTNFDTSKVTNMGAMFYACSGLTTLDVTHFDTSSVTNMSSMFSSCSGLTTLDVTHFNTSSVTNMHEMFGVCSGLTSLDVTHFNTSSVTDMSGMFYKCIDLPKLDVTHFDTSSVTSMEEMFCFCSVLTTLDVTKFDTEKVRNMSGMFSGCNVLTALDVTNFDTAEVRNMSKMFSGCRGLTALDVTNFDTAKVTDMSCMFIGCTGLTTLDVTNFDTAEVRNMSEMFATCIGLTALDVTNFDTAKVTDMRGMFAGCRVLTALDVTNFDTAEVRNMSQMFDRCINLQTILLGPNFDKLNGKYMFRDDSALRSIITQKDIIDSANAMTLSTDTGLDTLANAVLYVPNTISETAYEGGTNYSTVFGNDRIRPILELSGDSTVTVSRGSEYVDAGATVAGYTRDTNGEYPYDYDVTTSYKTNGGAELQGLPTDFTTGGTVYTIIYTLTYKNVEGMQVERTVIVDRTEIPLPTFEDKIYNGEEQHIETTSQFTFTGGTSSATNAGEYTVEVTPTSNYKWEDGSITSKPVTWKILPTSMSGSVTITGENTFGKTLTASVTTTPSTDSLTYQWYVSENEIDTSNPANITSGATPISGATSSTYVVGETATGKYVYVIATANAGDNYTPLTLADGTDPGNNTTAKADKATRTVSVPSTVEFTYGTAGSIEFSYSAEDTTIAVGNVSNSDSNVVSVTGVTDGNLSGTVTITLLKQGTTNIKITIPETANYKAVTSSACEVKVSRATGNITLDSTTGDSEQGVPNKTFTVLESHGGTLSAEEIEGNHGVTFNFSQPTATSGNPSTVTIGNIGGLTTGTVVKVRVTSAQTEQHEAASVEYTLTIKDGIGGSISITGTPKYLEELTVNTTNITPEGCSYTYVWWYADSSDATSGTAFAEETGSTITLNDVTIAKAGTTIEGLIGKYIGVTVVASKSPMGSQTFTVTKGPITRAKIASNEEPTASNKTYNGSAQTGVASGTNYTVSDGTKIDAGNYTAIATPKPGYEWSNGNTTAKQIPWSIKAKQITTVWGEADSYDYDGTEKIPSATVESGVEGETIVLTVTTVPSPAIVAGEYEAKANISSVIGGQGNVGNYVLISATKKYTIMNNNNFNSKPTITFGQEIISKSEVMIHAIVKSTTPLTSASVNGNPFSEEYIRANETEEGKWQVRTELDYSANINGLFKFEVTDKNGNTVSEVYNVTDISRESANITYTIFDATSEENAKIVFKATEDIQIVNIPNGFELDGTGVNYAKEITVYITNGATEINANFEFENNIGNKTVVNVNEVVEASYRNIRTVKNVVKKIIEIYTGGITLDRAEKLIARMKTARVTANGTRESYYGIDMAQVNVNVTSSSQITAVRALGKARAIAVKESDGSVKTLEKGGVDIITSAESASSTNGNVTGVYFTNASLVHKNNESGNGFHVTITNR